MMRKAVLLLVLGAVGGTIGCGADDDDTTPAGSGGVGGGIGPTSGAGASGTTGMSGMSGAGMSGAGMSGTPGMAGSAGGMDFVPGSATWGAVYREVLVDGGCGGSLCHSGPNVTSLAMADKDMTYDALINMPAGSMNLNPMATTPNCKDSGKKRVVPGMPDMSLLMEKIEKAMPSCGGPMPPSGMLAPAKIAQVRMWIMMGAKED